MPYCTNCGHQNPEGSNFCARCGEPMARVGAAAPGTGSGGAGQGGAGQGGGGTNGNGGTASPAPAPVERGAEADTEVHTFDATQVIKAVSDDGPPLTGEEEAAVRSLPAGSALLILNHGSDRSERFLISNDSTTVGRHPKSDIFLDDITVSRKHAIFQRSGAAVTVQDLGSLNGTYVNRTSIESPTTLATGDEVMVGKFRLIYFASEHGIG